MPDKRVYGNADVAVADGPTVHKTVHVTVSDGFVEVADGPHPTPEWTYPEHAVESIRTRRSDLDGVSAISPRSATVEFVAGDVANVQSVGFLDNGWIRLVYDHLDTDGYVLTDVPPARWREIEWHDD